MKGRRRKNLFYQVPQMTNELYVCEQSSDTLPHLQVRKTRLYFPLKDFKFFNSHLWQTELLLPTISPCPKHPFVQGVPPVITGWTGKAPCTTPWAWSGQWTATDTTYTMSKQKLYK